ncbi:hypothetical protein SAMN05444008_109166 [Cnuella takakiae]|uniref:Uncharacterized protein n=1 Tax=Cnuella takakiae TaxID=1302690 RepID=A0A1M5CQ21_9BACT|nr:hypothetical protein SAMN05444008_109166 [Cnuella takakiae]
MVQGLLRLGQPFFCAAAFPIYSRLQLRVYAESSRIASCGAGGETACSSKLLLRKWGRVIFRQNENKPGKKAALEVGFCLN